MIGNDMWTIDDFKKALEKADILNRPYLVVCHPDTKGILLETYPNLEHEFVLETSELLEDNKLLLIKRTDIQKWKLGEV